MSIFRKVRAVAGMALAWGIAWIPLALVTVTGLSLLTIGRWPGGALIGAAAVTGLLAGATSGALFAGLLAWRERGRTVAGLSAGRMAGLGVLAGLAPPALLILAEAIKHEQPAEIVGVMLVRVLTITGVLGAGCAGALLWTVRRAPTLPGERSAPELPSGPSEDG